MLILTEFRSSRRKSSTVYCLTILDEWKSPVAKGPSPPWYCGRYDRNYNEEEDQYESVSQCGFLLR